jgi:hypothetical protein
VTEKKKAYRVSKPVPIRAADGQAVTTIKHALEYAGPRPDVSSSSTVKKNYAERFSRVVATCIANRLRPNFPGITPDDEGRQQEMLARTAKGFKKLDVNFSTPELGLALGVSVKSINFPDWSAAKKKVGRFTKNYSRNDNELRAEAMDYHQRQPYSALVGVLFLPEASYQDAGKAGKREEEGVSSFGAAVKFFRNRAGRRTAKNEIDLFERFFIAVYNGDTGETSFFDVMSPPPRNRSPRVDECLSFEQFIQEIIKSYNDRNNPPFVWAE